MPGNTVVLQEIETHALQQAYLQRSIRFRAVILNLIPGGLGSDMQVLLMARRERGIQAAQGY